MDYNIEIFMEVLPLIKDFLYHLASYRLLHAYLEHLPSEREFWVYTCDAHLETATLTWCMVFGADSNETHWKKIFKGYNENAQKSFLVYLQAESGITEDNFKKYWADITTFRNNYIAHKTSYKKPVPNFDVACVLYILRRYNMKKAYTEEEKKNAVDSYLKGATISEISTATGIARSTLYIWVKKYNKVKASTRKVNMRDYFDLKQKCEQQEKMIEILKAATCTVSAPLNEKYEVIESLENKYSITLLCKAMNVAKGSYYNHKLRNKNENTLAAEKRAELIPIIEEFYIKSHERFGSGKVHAILKDRGYKVSPDTVATIMHENGWFAIGTSSKKQYLMFLERKQNLLNQKFKVSRPNEVWVSDITYFKYNDRTYYICVIIYLYARKVVGYRISLKNSTQLTKATVKIAYEYRQPTDLLFQNDQGTNYTSVTFRAYLKELGIRQSFSRSKTPYDNSVMESFFMFLKSESLYRTNFHSEKEFRTAATEYMHYYNDKRPHSLLRYQTPNKFEEQYFSKQAILANSQSNTDSSDK